MKTIEIMINIIELALMGSLLAILMKLERKLRNDERKENGENNSLSH